MPSLGFAYHRPLRLTRARATIATSNVVIVIKLIINFPKQTRDLRRRRRITLADLAVGGKGLHENNMLRWLSLLIRFVLKYK